MIFVLRRLNLKKINIIKNNLEYTRIIKSNKPFKYKDYILYIEKNQSGPYKFGISVSKKLGNAVTRNKLKRQIKSIIDQKHYENSFNCIIILRKGILTKNFQQKQDSLFNALKILNIIKEVSSEKE